MNSAHDGRLLDLADDAQVVLPDRGAVTHQVHVFDAASIDAVNAAYAAKRPLLVRGEPGTGKSQLAYAVAAYKERAFVSQTVDLRMEARDLLWQLDAVERLAEAQIQGAIGADKTSVQKDLAEKNFVRPGALWWAFDWTTAEGCRGAVAPQQQGKMKHQNGVVVLIDEIDKADSSVPNGLLEALGSGSFVPAGHKRVEMKATQPPLIVITTNEERALPDAFLRRCLVLTLSLPSDGTELKELLVRRGGAHFPQVHQDVLEAAADLLITDRAELKRQGLTPPGQAEFLDLVRSVEAQCSSTSEQRSLLERIARFTYRKHAGDPGAA